MDNDKTKQVLLEFFDDYYDASYGSDWPTMAQRKQAEQDVLEEYAGRLEAVGEKVVKL